MAAEKNNHHETATGTTTMPTTRYEGVTVSLVPEKKGLFLKHSEYEIRCQQPTYRVYRRYSDFDTLHSYLITKVPYRLIPRLPPKQIMMDSLLEERRKGLQIWLKIVCDHRILSQSAVLEVFLSEHTESFPDRMRDAFNSETDEYQRLTEDVELPVEDQGRLAVSRENMRHSLSSVERLKKLIDNQIQHSDSQSKDMASISHILKHMVVEVPDGVSHDTPFRYMVQGFQNVAAAAHECATLQRRAIGERLCLLHEVLLAHSDLCDRVEKGIVSEHQKALSKMLNLKQQKIKGLIRGSAIDTATTLHEKEQQQAGIAGTLGRRSAFSLYCILQETATAQQYLKALPSIVLAFCNEQHRGNEAIAEHWRNVLMAECKQLIS